MIRVWIYLFLFAVLAAIGTTEAVAVLQVVDVDLGGTPVHALGRYRYRDDLPFSPIATLAIHRTSDYRNHASTTNLANRGLATFGIRTRFGSSDAAVNFEQIALDIRNGIRFLKSKGHTKIILIGHSGGGPSTSYYQALLENGPSYCQGEKHLPSARLRELNLRLRTRPMESYSSMRIRASGSINCVRLTPL